ncbi:hypothetical protein MHL31_14415 [Lutibacter sp. A80]|uniref:hypothetical protein n=1 Tax=Lutibacter sp. A80 TaxID=2918453 RepID=UPI001F062338|nr:hypothetical protein [Lutibacter sp. A80]UMB60265.1 hypothetical protein MHL31_14415 [Lutibacter sp. A80]
MENKSQLASSTLFPSQQIEIKNEEFLGAFSLEKQRVITQKKQEKLNENISLDGLQSLSKEEFVREVSELLQKEVIDLFKISDNYYKSDINNMIYYIFKSNMEQGLQPINELETMIKLENQTSSKSYKGQLITNNKFIELAKMDALSRNISIRDLNNLNKN